MDRDLADSSRARGIDVIDSGDGGHGAFNGGSSGIRGLFSALGPNVNSGDDNRGAFELRELLDRKRCNASESDHHDHQVHDNGQNRMVYEQVGNRPLV